MITIDKRKMLGLLRKAVKERGADWRYENGNFDGIGCVYQSDAGEPACIVGHALYYYDPKLLKAFGSCANGAAFGGAAQLVVEAGYYDVHFTPGAYVAASRAQELQDAGFTWGEALAGAEDQ